MFGLGIITAVAAIVVGIPLAYNFYVSGRGGSQKANWNSGYDENYDRGKNDDLI